ncbi:hypothetical protein ACYJ1Y_17885, partial [Natrialbaceae archaeon A-gly3]
GALARTALIALQDSMYVFRNGGPEMSFAHRTSDFSYEDVMSQTEPTDPNLVGQTMKAAA